MTIRAGTSVVKRDKKKKSVSERKKHPIRFSVILCTYNRRNAVLAALACLRNQTLSYRDFEVIVVDNGSQDGTSHAIHAYMEMKPQKKKGSEGAWSIRCLSESKNGLAYARNTGLLAATGEIIVFIDDDTLIDPQMLENLWQAYEETRADAIGMRILVHWDAACPHWMVEELLDTLGHFAPSPRRLQLSTGEAFASCGFSVKREVLHALNYFSPLLSKRADLPANIEVANLCQCLHQAGYTLWYEPEALVLHRVTSARLHRAFFVSWSYWQGRSEVMLHAFQEGRERVRDVVHKILVELGHFARCLFVLAPLMHLAGRPTTERLLAAMEQAHYWGSFVQRLRSVGNVSPAWDIPAVLLVHRVAPDDSLGFLLSALDQQEVRYLTGQPEIPLGWLWQHRRYRDQPVGILHIYQPGALKLTSRQGRYVRLRLWLARRWGLRIVVTDNGGWWQSARNAEARRRRAFERQVLRASDIVITATRQPNLLYRDRRVRKRVRYLSPPGFRGGYPPALSREEAYHHLGLAPTSTFVYLCFAYLHSERELLFLLEAFAMLTQGSRSVDSLPDIQLLLVGAPADGGPSQRLRKLVERDSAVHVLDGVSQPTDIAQYMGACHALVLPHLAVRASGSFEIANLALSYERLVIAPDLPRFSGMLPHYASVPYVPASCESLAEALIKVQQMEFLLQPAERAALDFQQSWEDYTNGLLNLYRELLGQARP